MITPGQLIAQTRYLSRAFYSRPTPQVARELLGAFLIHETDGCLLAGKIVEAEAYLGEDDEAAHAFRGLTSRTRVLFGPPGHAYVFLNYGIHECLNLVAEPEGRAGCVLIRALEPVCGIDEMWRRRPKAKKLTDLASGPGKLTRALGITREHYGADVTRGPLRVCAPKRRKPFAVGTSTRIGISVSVDLPLRFFVEGNPHVSVKHRTKRA